MNGVDIIIKKRDGNKLSKEEIDFFISEYTRGTIPDYQAAAWAMAVYFQGMDDEETTCLTLAMRNSGEVLSLERAADFSVDKHSTGGVGDKTTLIVQPIVNACGVSVAKMSGRGLGFSGGTIDKLESIPGIHLNLSKEEFLSQLKEYGTVISGQSKDLAPADGKLYALRDVTGTVPAPALIASSIMSKKLAIVTDAILLDVKVGKGAFMKDIESAKNLARRMVEIGKRAGRIMRAELSDMNQPLGFAVGNILEVKEAVDFLNGKPAAPDLWEHCIDSSALLLQMAKKAETLEEGRAIAIDALRSGKALGSLELLVRLQGGDVSYLKDLSRFPEAPFIQVFTAEKTGFIHSIDAEIVGETSVHLGAGRVKKTDEIDHRVGIVIHHKVGDKVSKGDLLFTIYANSEETMQSAGKAVMDAHKILDTPCEPLPQFYGIVE